MGSLNHWLRPGLFWQSMRIAWRYLNEGEDPWVRLEHDEFGRDPTPHFFGAGAVRPFQWYLEGPSEVAPATLDELLEWLMACEYVHDSVLFQVEDYWQHPRTFEQLRKGDCEDHALWAWRKFHELGLDTELVVGRSRSAASSDEFGGHAWVHVNNGNHVLVIETTCKDKDGMVLTLEDARDHYRPHVSIDGKLRGRMYGGLPQTVLEAKRAKKEARREPPRPPSPPINALS